jgi:hypothetical protein
MVTTFSISCTSTGDKNKQELQQEKHDSAHKEKKEIDYVTAFIFYTEKYNCN